MILLLLYLQSYFKIGNTILPPRLPIRILIRSVLIILTWYFLIGPLISLLLKKWLSKRQSASKREIMEVTQLLPSIRNAMSKSWKATSTTKGIKKIILCCKLILVYTLYPFK